MRRLARADAQTNFQAGTDGRRHGAHVTHRQVCLLKRLVHHSVNSFFMRFFSEARHDATVLRVDLVLACHRLP
jgi:hypothetical protein